MPGLFKPDWGSLKAHQDPGWFRDAMVCIYTHWGPVTVGREDAPQGGKWYGREMYLTNNPIFASMLLPQTTFHHGFVAWGVLAAAGACSSVIDLSVPFRFATSSSVG
jgi:Alpha-L-fucosidase